MLALPRRQQIYLPSAGHKSSRVLAADSEQNKFGDVAEIKPDATSIGAAILAHFVPNDIGFVGEAPGLHDRETVRKHGVGTPQIEVRRWRRHLGNRQLADLGEFHGAVARKALV